MEIKEKLKELISSYEGDNPIRLLREVKDKVRDLYYEELAEIHNDFKEVEGKIPLKVKRLFDNTVFKYIPKADVYTTYFEGSDISDEKQVEYRSYANYSPEWVVNNLDDKGECTWETVGEEKIERVKKEEEEKPNSEEDNSPRSFVNSELVKWFSARVNEVPIVSNKATLISDYYNDKLDNNDLFTAELESIYRYMYTTQKEIRNRLRKFEEYFNKLI